MVYALQSRAYFPDISECYYIKRNRYIDRKRAQMNVTLSAYLTRLGIPYIVDTRGAKYTTYYKITDSYTSNELHGNLICGKGKVDQSWGYMLISNFIEISRDFVGHWFVLWEFVNQIHCYRMVICVCNRLCNEIGIKKINNLDPVYIICCAVPYSMRNIRYCTPKCVQLDTLLILCCRL